MIKLLIAAMLLISAFNVSANQECNAGGCFPLAESDIMDQSQRQAITNSNTAVLTNPLSISSPLMNMPVTTMGKDIDACSTDYTYVGVGASHAKMVGVDSTTFGNGSVALGAQAGKVWANDNDHCLARQRLRLANDQFTSVVSRQLACLNYDATITEQGGDTLVVLKAMQNLATGENKEVERDFIEYCGALVTQLNANKQAKKQAQTQLANVMAPKAPSFSKISERRQVGWHDFRIHLGNFLVCSACDEQLSEELELKACTACSPEMRDRIKMKRIKQRLAKAGYTVDGTNTDVFEYVFAGKDGKNYISLNLKPGTSILTNKSAKTIQQSLMNDHEIYGKVRGMFGAEKFETYERLVQN